MSEECLSFGIGTGKKIKRHCGGEAKGMEEWRNQLICWLIDLLIYLFIYLSIHSFVRSSIDPTIHSMFDWSSSCLFVFRFDCISVKLVLNVIPRYYLPMLFLRDLQVVLHHIFINLHFVEQKKHPGLYLESFCEPFASPVEKIMKFTARDCELVAI